MPTRSDSEEQPWQQEQDAAETDFERRLAQIQASQAAKRAKPAKPQVRSNLTRHAPAPTDRDKLSQPIEDHHRAVGSFLKMIDAALIDLRYTHYLHDREVGGTTKKILKATQELRAVLDRRRTRSLGGRPGGDTYYGEELTSLHNLDYAIETALKIHQENLQSERKLDREIPLGVGLPGDPTRRLSRRVQLTEAKRAPLEDHVRQELHQAIGAVVNAARQQPPLFDKDQPPPAAVSVPAPAMVTDRHAELRAALIANPDQPQAVFVARFRVHPDTVRRCRRELEAAGAIPILAHRLRRHTPLAEAAGQAEKAAA